MKIFNDFKLKKLKDVKSGDSFFFERENYTVKEHKGKYDLTACIRHSDNKVVHIDPDLKVVVSREESNKDATKV